MSTDTPANYRDPDPPFPNGHFGWGLETETPDEKLKNEKERADSLPFLVTAAEAPAASQLDEAIVKIIKSKFRFDKGWNFWTVEEMVYGIYMMIVQLIGNCVGASHCALLATRIAHEILVEGQPEEALGKLQLAQPFIAYSYGVGRMAGNMLGPGDGSYCSAQMEGTEKYGFLPCSTPGLDAYAGSGDAALPQGTASAERLFGRSRSEILKWTEKAVKFKMAKSPRVTTADEVWDMIVEKHIPLQICSSQGFRFKEYDASLDANIYVRGGSWSHSMQLKAAVEKNGRRFVGVGNQWGRQAHKGSPGLNIPDGCMAVPWEELVPWMRSAEVMGIGEIDGLPSNPGF